MQHVGVRIWYTVCKVNKAILFFELVLKGQALHSSAITALLVISKLFVFEHYLDPALLPFLSRLPPAIRFHSIFIQQITLLEVDQIKLHSLIELNVGNFEVKPGGISFCIAINSHQQVILLRAYQDGQIEIAAFEIGIKAQILLLYCWVHPVEQTILKRMNRENLLLLIQEQKFKFLKARFKFEAKQNCRLLSNIVCTFQGQI